MCKAFKRERELPHQQHDRKYHAALLETCLNPKAVCCISGLSQHTLAKLSDGLTVDRIDSNVGYLKGNCQLMARSLNLAKGQGDSVPQFAINDLMRRAARLVNSRHDKALPA